MQEEIIGNEDGIEGVSLIFFLSSSDFSVEIYSFVSPPSRVISTFSGVVKKSSVSQPLYVQDGSSSGSDLLFVWVGEGE